MSVLIMRSYYDLHIDYLGKKMSPLSGIGGFICDWLRTIKYVYGREVCAVAHRCVQVSTEAQSPPHQHKLI